MIKSDSCERVKCLRSGEESKKNVIRKSALDALEANNSAIKCVQNHKFPRDNPQGERIFSLSFLLIAQENHLTN